jgi:hypothetical protein
VCYLLSDCAKATTLIHCGFLERHAERRNQGFTLTSKGQGIKNIAGISLVYIVLVINLVVSLRLL